QWCGFGGYAVLFPLCEYFTETRNIDSPKECLEIARFVDPEMGANEGPQLAAVNGLVQLGQVTFAINAVEQLQDPRLKSTGWGAVAASLIDVEPVRAVEFSRRAMLTARFFGQGPLSSTYMNVLAAIGAVAEVVALLDAGQTLFTIYNSIVETRAWQPLLVAEAHGQYELAN
ncbi:MAG: hypothetical protein OEV76_11485, partial [Anaerolineae bacterium]|nr:hypothetical protein [Anaerolineae bacterium]